jgi:Tol biopolymer transport system component
MMSVEEQLAAYCQRQEELHPAIMADEVGGPTVRVTTSVSGSRPVWWVGAAAAVTILVIGGFSAFVGNRLSGSDDEVRAGTPSIPYDVGRHSLEVGGISLSFEIPAEGWEADSDVVMGKNVWRDQRGATSFGQAIVFFATFPGGDDVRLCRGVAPGRLPTTSDLDVIARSFASVGRADFGVENWVVGGLPARHVEVEIRDLAGCNPGYFYEWNPTAGGASWTESEVGDTVNAWFVDVDGVVVAIVAETRGLSATLKAKGEIFPIVDSIRFPSIARPVTTDYVIDLDSGERTLLPEAIRNSAPSGYAASPDGTKLAYIAPDEDGSFQLFTAGIDGTGIDQITHPPAEAGSPAWSPDGTTLAYTDSGGVFLLDVDTGETKQIPGVVAFCCLQFTPDGSSILYTSNRQDSAAQIAAQWTVSIDGSENTPLIGVDQGIEAAFAGSISPDGSHVTFLGSRIGGPGALLFIADVDDPRPEVLHDMDAGDCGTGNPSGVWSPDGNSIVCSRGPDAVIVIDIATGATTHAYLGNAAIWLDDHTLLVESWGN